jgi:hypothetical protein
MGDQDMTDALRLYLRAQNLGLQLEADGGDLLVRPGSKCPPDFVAVLRERKAELLQWLSRPPCPGIGAVPPADLPLMNLQPRPSIRYRELVIHYLLRQAGDRPGLLSAWLVRRECAYYDGPGRVWDCALHAYAAARDAACWQLNRCEAEVWQLLEGFDEAANNPRA